MTNVAQVPLDKLGQLERLLDEFRLLPGISVRQHEFWATVTLEESFEDDAELFFSLCSDVTEG